MTEIYSISLLVYSSTFKGSECVWGFLNDVREPSTNDSEVSIVAIKVLLT